MGTETDAVVEQIESACRELGLSRSAIQTIVQQVDSPDASLRGRVDELIEENRQLRTELRSVRDERDRLADRQREIVELIGGQSEEKLMHDLRNMLNELVLLQTLASRNT